MRRFPLLLLALAAGVLPARAVDDPDEAAVKAAGLSADPAALLDFVRQRSRETAAADEFAPLVKDLASADPKAADKAAAALVARGPLAVPALRRAANDLADKPLADRARKALGYVEGRPGPDLAGRRRAAARHQEAGRRRRGRCSHYLPYADDTNRVLEAVGSAPRPARLPGREGRPGLAQGDRERRRDPTGGRG